MEGKKTQGGRLFLLGNGSKNPKCFNPGHVECCLILQSNLSFGLGEARKQYEVGVPHMPNPLNSLTNENTSHLQFQAATIPNIERQKLGHTAYVKYVNCTAGW
jgi:hypothetical protein